MITFSIIEDPEEAKRLWELFSPHKTIDDDWEFRNTWTEGFDFPFHFIVGYDGEKPIGLLPLQFNTLKGLGPRLLNMTVPYLEFFAGIDTDDNDVWVLPGYEQYKLDFYRQIKKTAVLTSLKEPFSFDSSETEYYLDRFELKLTEFSTLEDFTRTHLDGPTRQRLINRLNKLRRNYTVEVVDATEKELDLLFQFSIDRFGERSSFNLSHRQQIFKNLSKRFTVDLFALKLNGEIKAVSFSFIYNGSYITLNMGYDYEIRDISKLLVMTQMERALEKGCNRFDAGQGDNGWKSHFHFTKVPQYKLVLNMPEQS